MRDISRAYKLSTGKLVNGAFILGWHFKQGFIKGSTEGNRRSHDKAEGLILT